MSTGFYLLCPIMIGFAAVADSFVRLVLTEKWLPSVPFIQVFCFQFILKPLKNISKSSLKAKGRSDLDLAVNIFEKIVGISFVIIFMKNGPLVLALTAMITYIISTIVNMFVNSRVIKYSIKEQIFDMVPYFFISAISCAPSFLLNYTSINLILKLIVQVVLGIFMYVSISYIFKLSPFIYVKNFIKELTGKRFKKKCVDNNS